MPKISIVVPCYNEFNRLPKEVFLGFIKLNPEILFCFVNDGSSDKTADMLKDLQQQYPGSIEVVDNQKNQGKAEAVRSGVLHVLNTTSVDFVSYLDADLATPIEEILRLYETLNSREGVEMVLASRIKRLGANISRKGSRHVLGRIFATSISLLFEIPIYDSQCGAKLIKRELATKIFAEPLLSKWLFDVELVVRAKQCRNNRIDHLFEMPLNEWIEKGDSRIKLKDVLVFPYHLARIKRHYK
ncbi:glycosyltransferase [Paraflavitalea soli]|nr:glycosyltransferase [Paraflavitalea soli]